MEIDQKTISEIKRSSQNGYLKQYGPFQIAGHKIYEFWIRREGEFDTCYVLFNKDKKSKILSNFNSLCLYLQENHNDVRSNNHVKYFAMAVLLMITTLLIYKIYQIPPEKLGVVHIMAILAALVATVGTFLFDKFIKF